MVARELDFELTRRDPDSGPAGEFREVVRSLST
jgi:hypothetical protein